MENFISCAVAAAYLYFLEIYSVSASDMLLSRMVRKWLEKTQ